MIDQSDNNAPPKGYADDDVRRWLSLIAAAQKDMEAWNRRCDKIRDVYRSKNTASNRVRKYALLYSNIETLKPAVYGKAPKPIVESRYKTNDPVSRVAGQMLERAISFQMETCRYDETFKALRDDYLLYSRGVPRLRYQPVMQEADIEDGLDEAAVEGAQLDAKQELEDAEPNEVLAFEHAFCDYVHRHDFIHPAARTWGEVSWIAYQAFLTRDQLIKRFGKKVGSAIPLDSRQENERDRAQDRTQSAEDKATIYEIWDKANKKVCWVAKGYQHVLEEDEPYLKLNGFFPSPKPAYGIMTNDTLVPVPDYIEYQDQAEEVDELTARIAALQDSLKVVGFYPGGPSGEGAPEIEKAARPGFENKMVAVKAWDSFTEGGRGGTPIVWWPAEKVAQVLEYCVKLRKELIDDVYQITGISDIMRGDTDPDETAAAQGMKQANGGNRIKTRQREISRVCAEVVQMAGEIIAEQFDISTLMKMSDMQLPSDADVQNQKIQYKIDMLKFQVMQQQPPQGAPPPGQPPQQAQPQQQPPPPPPDLGPTQEQVMALLRDNVLRRFRLDIETDSTVAMDEAGEQQRRTSFIEQTTQFVVGWAPLIEQAPALASLAGVLLKFGVSAFPAAREIEGEIDKIVDQLIAGAQEPKPPAPPDPETQAKLQIADMNMQGKLAQTKQQMQNDQEQHQFEMQQLAAKGQIEQMKASAEIENARMEVAASAQDHMNTMREKNMDLSLRMQDDIMSQRRQILAPERSRANSASNPIAGKPAHPSVAPSGVRLSQPKPESIGPR